jgi:hypothetical protein
MHKYILFALFFVMASSAHALNVQLASGVCNQAPARESTGLVLSYKNLIYVLGSADFIIGGGNYCHVARDANGKTYALKLQRYDWASGFALLTGPAELNSLATPLAPAPSKLLQRLTWDNSGAGLIVAVQSKRHHYADLPFAFEIKGSAINSHAVGMGMYTTAGALAGVVGSFVIEEVPGHSSRIARWTDRLDGTSANFIGIPADEIAAWIDKTLAPNWAPALVTFAEDQIANKHRVQIGHLVFAEDCPPPDYVPGDDPNYPIGGNDAVGIGGDTASMPACNFHVSLASTEAVTAPRQLRDAWLAKLEGYVRSGKKFVVQNAYARFPDTEGLQSVAAVSMGNFGYIFLHSPFDFLLRFETQPTDPKYKDFFEHCDELISWARFNWGSRNGGQMNLRQRNYLYSSLQFTEDRKAVLMTDWEKALKDAREDNTALKQVGDAIEKIIADLKTLGE